jgi:hypothetical protein
MGSDAVAGGAGAGIFSGTSLCTRRLVPIFYGKLRPAGAQTVWLLHFMVQMYATQRKTSILNNNHPTKNNTMVEPVAVTAAWLWRISQPYPREPLRKG